ncbi:MFS transporter [Bailinhaonella thermotolerans]|uniref:MFS transporter n=1 Tax=Bailinhaonella thermotolerans TaxID=1070861 RepID=A0A3A4AXP1_9ACTN|nr:MFS transporter [Bailinhaonella thermotolerans]RJL33179.1 MFS transporter [Bailinhaonella thermotolerans]
MLASLPRAAKALLCVRVLNQVGAYAIAFLAVFAGPARAPLVLVVFGVATLISRWGGAFLLDRLPPRTVVALGLASTGLALTALSLSWEPVPVLISVALLGLSFEIYEPATSELIAETAEGEVRQEVFGLLGASLVAAGAVAGVIAAVLLPVGVRWLVVVDAVTCFAAAAVAVLFLPAGGPRARRSGPRWRPPRDLLRDTAAATLFAVGHLAITMFTQAALLQRGAPAWVPGVTLTAAALLSPPVMWATRRALTPRPHRRVLSGGSAVAALLSLFLAAPLPIPFTIAAYLAWSAAMAVLLGRWTALIADAAPEADRPRWFAFYGSSWGLAQPAVPVAVALATPVLPLPGQAPYALAAAAFLLVPAALRRPAVRPAPEPQVT